MWCQESAERVSSIQRALGASAAPSSVVFAMSFIDCLLVHFSTAFWLVPVEALAAAIHIDTSMAT